MRRLPAGGRDAGRMRGQDGTGPARWRHFPAQLPGGLIFHKGWGE